MTLDDLARQAHYAAEGLLECAVTAVRERVSAHGKLDAAKIEAEQHAVHGLAWLATYVEAIKEMAAYVRAHARGGPVRPDRGAADPHRARRISRPDLRRHPDEPGRDRPPLRLRPVGEADIEPFRDEPVVEALITVRQHAPRTARRSPHLIEEAHEGAIGDPGLDETLEAIRGEMRRFADAEVVPHAQDWHRTNAYIPLEVIAGLSEMGVFGLTIPEAYGGMGLGKVAMCVVSEELSRGYIGVGSLGTRSEIAAELILVGGTEAQKAEIPAEDRQRRDPADRRLHRAQHRLRPRLACAPARRARATHYVVNGAKTWITHPVRADLMTLLVRTNPHEKRLQGPLDAAGREAARHRRRPVPGQGHVGRRDRGARLSRHEGIRDRLRRLPRSRRRAARRRRGPGLQAADGDLRVGPHPDGGARGRRRAMRLRTRPALRQGARAVRQDADPLSRASPTSSR